MKLLILSISILLSVFQNSPKPKEEKPAKIVKPYLVVEQMPTYPGGKYAMNRFISQNLKYPEDAYWKGIQGKVIVGFVVDETGALKEINFVGKKLGYGLEEAAIAVFQKMPKWVAGKHDGKLVPVYTMIPIVFKLN